MKAYVLHGIGEFHYEDVAMPELLPGTVLVRVKAAGICGSDIPRIYRTGTYSYPLIPGHEFAGEVVALGEQVDDAWMGQRVGVFPLIPCMECPQCRKKQYEMCDHYDYLGSRTNGGFAEYVRVPEWNLIALPDLVTMEQAAMLEPMAVAVHTIRQIELINTAKIAVCGMGTIGLFVAMFLMEMGCENVYVAGNKDFQRGMCLKMGLPEEHYCDVRENDFAQWLKQKTNELGVDFYFDCVGKNEILSQGIDSLAAKGTMVLVGNPATDITLDKNLYWKILRRQLQLTGTWNSSYTHDQSDDWHYVLQCLAQNRIHPEKLITHHMNRKTFYDGFEIMRDKREDYVKVMMVDETEN